MSRDVNQLLGRPVREWGELYDLLKRAFPGCVKNDRLSVEALTERIEVSKEGIYKWVRADRISVAQAHRLVKLSRHVTINDFVPYILNR
jgi:hypothetical protein